MTSNLKGYLALSKLIISPIPVSFNKKSLKCDDLIKFSLEDLSIHFNLDPKMGGMIIDFKQILL